jgi:hypothetical protein
VFPQEVCSNQPRHFPNGTFANREKTVEGEIRPNALVLTGVAKFGLVGCTESPLMTVDLRGAACAAGRISSTLKGSTKQFGWLQAPATKNSFLFSNFWEPRNHAIDIPPSGRGIDEFGSLRVLLKAVLPSYVNIVSRLANIPLTLGEPAAILWLLIRGAKDQPLEAGA